MGKDRDIALRFPRRGVVENWGYDQQPGDTAPDAQNVRTHESFKHRARGGSRNGISKFLTDRPTSATTSIQNLNQVSSISVETVFEEDDEATLDWAKDVNANSGGHMEGVAFDDDGNIYVVGVRDAGNTRSVWKYDPSGTTLLASYDTGGNTFGISVGKVFDVDSGTHVTRVVVAGARASSKSVWMLDADLTLGWSGDTGGDAYAAVLRGQINSGATMPGAAACGVRTASKSVWKFSNAGAVTTSMDLGDDAYDLVNTNGGVDSLIIVGDRNTAWTGSGGANASVWKWRLNSLDAFDAGGDMRSCAYDYELSRAIVGGLSNSAWQGRVSGSASVFSITDLGDGVNNSLGTVGTTPPVWDYDADDCYGIAVDFDSNVYGTATGTATNRAVFKVDDDGTELWLYEGNQGTEDQNAIAVNSDKELAVAGNRDAAEPETLMKLTTTDLTTIISQPRKIDYLVVHNGTIRRFTSNDTYHDITDGIDALRTGTAIRSAEAYSRLFYVDGVNYKFYDPATNAILPWIPTAGDLPDDSDNDGTADNSKGARKIVRWGGRIVMFGTQDDPHNWFMSAVGDPFDWDYAPANQSESQAVAGNLAGAGLIGQVIRVAIPWDDRLLIWGCDGTIWRSVGNPAAGGVIENVSETIGISHDQAWCRDPSGYIYFFASTGGVYRMAPGGIPERISNDRIEKRLLDFDLSDINPIMEWNQRDQGVHLFMHSKTDTSAHRDFFWDKRNDAWWPDAMPGAMHPTYSFTIDGDLQGDRRMLLGGQDGYIRYWNPNAKSDDGTAISSYVWLGPVGASPGREIKIRSLGFLLGETSDACDYGVYVGDTPEGALLSSTPVFNGSLVAGRNARINNRARGFAALIKLSNSTLDKAWAFEHVSARMMVGGEARQR